MSTNYKLKEEIQQFIIEQKKLDPKLSCRGMTALVLNKFRVKLSKSLINRVFKDKQLSSPVGRRKTRQVEIPVPPPVKLDILFPEIRLVRQSADFMENAGFYFLKAADFKLGLTFKLAQVLSGFLPSISVQNHQAVIEALVYAPHFKDKKSLWLLIGAEVPDEATTRYSEELILAPFAQIKESVGKTGINTNFNEINGLWKETVARLNSFIVHYFPPEYQFLDFRAMQARFYCLPGQIERRPGFLAIHLFYPAGFFGLNDVIWQEGFSSAANRLNDAKVLTADKERIWVNPQVRFP